MELVVPEGAMFRMLDETALFKIATKQYLGSLIILDTMAQHGQKVEYEIYSSRWFQ